MDAAKSSRLFAAGIAALIFVVVIPIVFLSSILGASAASCGTAVADGGSGKGPTIPVGEFKDSDPPGMPAMEIARRIYAVANRMEMGDREVLTAYTVVMVETGGGITMQNTKGGLDTSTGAFQQQAFAPWNRRNRDNVSAAATSFFEALRGFDHGQSIGELAADIQRPLASLRFKYALALPGAERFLERVKNGGGESGADGLGSITAPGSSCGGAAGPVGPPGKIGKDNDLVPPEDAPPRVVKVIEAANRINHLPYVWGGGHGSFENSRGYDCSGAVGYALHAGGFQSTTMVSGAYGSWGQRGPGKWITVWSNGGHVFMYVAGVRFDTSCYAPSCPGTGPRWRPTRRPHAGFVATHPPGF